MDRRLVIIQWDQQIMTAVYEDDVLVELLFDDTDGRLLGNVYVGKVKNIVKNINAAFVEFDKGQHGYYSLTENTAHFFTNTKKGNIPVAGDELLVQVIKDPIKSKLPMLTGQLAITGANLVLTANKTFVGVSAKITSETEKKRLKAIVEPLTSDMFGFIVRTEASGKAAEALSAEAGALSAEFEHILEKGRYSPCFTKVYAGAPAYMKYIQSHPDIARITTDLPAVYETIARQQKLLGTNIPLVLYEDPSWPLCKVKSMETLLRRALSPQVWLKSGGFLMIQPTEGLVVIDVNTGKYTGKKAAQETFFKINMEAATEIGRQLRLRNLSGIIIIDFIDMKNPAMRSQLLEHFGQVLKKDSVKTVLVDMTRLNLVEMTRKKERRPLYEQLGHKCPECHGSGYVY